MSSDLNYNLQFSEIWNPALANYSLWKNKNDNIHKKFKKSEY